MRFDLSSIPTEATIDSARLELYAAGWGGTNINIGAYAVLRQASLCQTTWNQAQAGNPWALPGGNDTTTDRRAVPESSLTTTGIGKWYSFALTSLVQEWVGGTLPNNGVMMRGDSSAYAFQFDSNEHADISLRPKLIVTYRIVPTPTPTLTATPTPTPTPPPTVDAGPDATISEGDTFTQTGYVTGCCAPGSNCCIGSVDYGDGTGSFELTFSEGTFALSHTYLQSGICVATVTVTDTWGGVGSDSLIVTVNNVPPSVDAGPDAMISEGNTFSSSGLFTDPGADSWSATVDYGDGTSVQSLPLSGKTFALSHTYADNGIYTVVVTVNDNDYGVGTDTVSVTVNNVVPIVEAGPNATMDEGGTFVSSGWFTDPGADTWNASVDYGDGSGVQALTLTGKTFALSHTFADNGSFAVTVIVWDDDSGVGQDTATVIVENVAPTVGPIVATQDPVMVGAVVSASSPFSDPGTADTHTALWEWGDGNSTPGTVQETPGSESVTGDHIYTSAGLYTIKLTVTDDDLESGYALFRFVVVCDPEGGFVTGGGWFDSPAGAYVSNPSLLGKATFGFEVKYHKRTTVPTGQTEFQLKGANLNFHSTSYQWLVVAGSKAVVKGSGTINGVGGYGFVLSAIDGDIPRGAGADKFRIRIWVEATGLLIYDNLLDAPEDSDPITALGGGSIAIHQAK